MLSVASATASMRMQPGLLQPTGSGTSFMSPVSMWRASDTSCSSSLFRPSDSTVVVATAAAPSSSSPPPAWCACCCCLKLRCASSRMLAALQLLNRSPACCCCCCSVPHHRGYWQQTQQSTRHRSHTTHSAKATTPYRCLKKPAHTQPKQSSEHHHPQPKTLTWPGGLEGLGILQAVGWQQKPEVAPPTCHTTALEGCVGG